MDSNRPASSSSWKASRVDREYDSDQNNLVKTYNIAAKLATIAAVVGGLMYIAVSTVPTSPTYQSLQLVKTGRGPVKYQSLTDDDKIKLFEDFMSSYNRQYDDEDETKLRYQNFVATLSVIDERNAAEEAKGGSAIHGITKFADWSPDEAQKILGSKTSSALQLKSKAKRVSMKADRSVDDVTVNWAGTLTTAVKDQGYCGSCWAFSGVSQIESDSIKAGYLTTSDTLSEQQIVSCDSDDGSEGCDGGYLDAVFDYAMDTSIALSSDYPYTSYYDVTGTCSSDLTSLSKTVGVSDYYYLDSEESMMAYVSTTGPVAVCLDASSWYTYTSGVLSVCGDEVDHCVQAVGVSINSSGTSYWIVRNSWGTDWGLDGYIYLEYGSNLCDIDSSPIYSSVFDY